MIVVLIVVFAGSVAALAGLIWQRVTGRTDKRTWEEEQRDYES